MLNIPMEQAVQKLEKRVGDLLEVSETIERENQTLRNDRRLLQQECQTLREKNKIARGRVEQIVARLKSIDI